MFVFWEVLRLFSKFNNSFKKKLPIIGDGPLLTPNGNFWIVAQLHSVNDTLSATQAVARILCDANVHYRVQYFALPLCVQSQI
jgi:hypothetical protein